MPENPAGIVYGRIYVGLLFNILLFGILITQYYIYHTTYKRDPTWIKTFVWALMTLDIFNSVVNSYFIYDGVITHFGDFDYLLEPNWCISADTVVTALVAFMVQSFFAWRIQVLIRKWYLTLVIVAISLAALVMVIVGASITRKFPHYSDLTRWKGAVVSWLVCTAVSDVIISVSLVWFLRTHKTGFKKSDAIVDRIIRITVQTGLLTSIVAVLDIIMFLSKSDGTHLMLNTPLCKLYANSILSSLNARGGWRSSTDSLCEETSQFVGTTSHFQSFRIDAGPSNLTSNVIPEAASQNISTGPVKSTPDIRIHLESHEINDDILKKHSLSTEGHKAEVDGTGSPIMM